jgi:hypothetical protein
MHAFRSFLLCALAVTLLSCAAARSTGETTITNDSYSEDVKVTITKYHVESGSDAFLRARVPKSGGSPSYQIYFEMIAEEDWQYWDESRYKTRNAVKTLMLDEIASEPKCTSGMCFMHEDVGASVSKETLQEVASASTDTLRVYSGQYSNYWEPVALPEKGIRDLLADVDSLSQRF